MLRSVGFVFASLLLACAALAETAAPAAAPAAAAPAADAPPPLPPAPAATTTPAPAAATTTAPATPVTLTPEELAKLKAEIKSELAAEMLAQQKANQGAAAAAGAQKTEQTEEKWIEEVKPNLQFIELDGYFRTRFDLFSRLDLNTYDPVAQRGTSGFPVPTMYRPFDGENCVDGAPANFAGDTCEPTKEDSQTILSTNMRLRLDPTLNVSDDIRVRSTMDVFDNVVLGSTPESLPGFAQNPTLPLPLFASSQNAPQATINSMYDAIRIKRVWAEVGTPIGQLRFGRMGQQFGLGLLANDGNKLDNDYGDNSDQVMFATRVAGHYIVPAYSFSSSGPIGRGGGAGLAGDFGFAAYPGEGGQRYDLDPKDDVHSFILVIAKRDKDEEIAEQLRNGQASFNYGLFSVYRTQQFDVPSYYSKTGGQAATSNPVVTPAEYVKRSAQAGIGSLWARFQYEKFKIEAEAVGILGYVEGTATSSNGYATVDDALKVVDGNKLKDSPLWIIQGGAALESSYKFLNDQLVVGLDGGVASGDDAFGMGMRPVINQNPKAGDLDGKQYGQCLERDPDGKDRDADGNIDCKVVDDNITNFRFDPDFQVDLILFREILGTVTDAWYAKPHIGYSITDNLGLRLDLIYSQAIYASSTPGQQNPLGLEADLTGYYGTEDGFYMMLQYGFLLPFGAFSHYDTTAIATQFQQPQFAQTFQVFGGVQF